MKTDAYNICFGEISIKFQLSAGIQDTDFSKLMRYWKLSLPAMII